MLKAPYLTYRSNSQHFTTLVLCTYVTHTHNAPRRIYTQARIFDLLILASQRSPAEGSRRRRTSSERALSCRFALLGLRGSPRPGNLLPFRRRRRSPGRPESFDGHPSFGLLRKKEFANWSRGTRANQFTTFFQSSPETLDGHLKTSLPIGAGAASPTGRSALWPRSRPPGLRPGGLLPYGTLQHAGAYGDHPYRNTHIIYVHLFKQDAVAE